MLQGGSPMSGAALWESSTYNMFSKHDITLKIPHSHLISVLAIHSSPTLSHKCAPQAPATGAGSGPRIRTLCRLRCEIHPSAAVASGVKLRSCRSAPASILLCCAPTIRVTRSHVPNIRSQRVVVQHQAGSTPITATNCHTLPDMR